MAKRVKRKPRRVNREQGRSTNWWLVGGIIVAGLVVIFGLLFSALQEPKPTTLTDHCLDNPDNCIFDGDADAPVRIVEISDYGCSHCRDFNLQTASLLKDLYVNQGEVQWIVMPFALSTLTLPAAGAAMCAADQGHFEDFHRGLFEIQGDPAALTAEGLGQLASELGLDQAAFNRCVADGVYDNIIQENVREASLAGVNATPTFFINDKKLSGNYPLTTFQEEIAGATGMADANQ